MNIHEYQAKEILKNFNVKIQEGYVANSPDEAYQNAKKLSDEKDTNIFVIKAQIQIRFLVSWYTRSPANLFFWFRVQIIFSCFQFVTSTQCNIMTIFHAGNIICNLNFISIYMNINLKSLFQISTISIKSFKIAKSPKILKYIKFKIRKNVLNKINVNLPLHSNHIQHDTN